MKRPKRKRKPTRRDAVKRAKKKEVGWPIPVRKIEVPATIPVPIDAERFEQGLVLLADHITGLNEQLITFNTRVNYLAERIVALESLYKQLGNVDVMKFTPDYFHKWLGRLQQDIADLHDSVEHERAQQRRGRLGRDDNG